MTTNGNVDWRRLSGAGETTPPNIEPPSRSEGDLNRNSYRASQYPRLSARAVANDDGTPIGQGIEYLLRVLLEMTDRLEQRETDLGRLVLAVEAAAAKTQVTGRGVAVVEQSKSLAAAADYAAGDVMSESATDGAGTDWDFRNVVNSPGGAGTITKAIAICSTTALTHGLTLFLFHTSPTSELDDNAGNTAPLEADNGKFVGAIDFPALVDIGTGQSYVVATPSTSGNLPIRFHTAPEARDLFGIAVTRDAVTGEAVGMRQTFILFIDKD